MGRGNKEGELSNRPNSVTKKLFFFTESQPEYKLLKYNMYVFGTILPQPINTFEENKCQNKNQEATEVLQTIISSSPSYALSVQITCSSSRSRETVPLIILSIFTCFN